MDDDDFAKLLLDFTEEQLLEASEEEDIAELLLEPSEELLDITELLLESTEELDEDFALLDVMPDSVPASPFLRLLDDDFAFELLEPSQSSQADEDSFPSGRVAKSLSSSPQATSTATTIPITNNFLKDINSSLVKYTLMPSIEITFLKWQSPPLDKRFLIIYIKKS